MKILLLLVKKPYLRSALILPLVGLALFTGCSSLNGSADNRPALKARVATYTQQNPENQGTAADTDEDPGYEWFY